MLAGKPLLPARCSVEDGYRPTSGENICRHCTAHTAETDETYSRCHGSPSDWEIPARSLRAMALQPFGLRRLAFLSSLGDAPPSTGLHLSSALRHAFGNS